MSNAIEVSGLRKRYLDIHGRWIQALDGVDLDVPEGGVFGILGPNGAGKTTAIRVLVGLVGFSAGTVSVLGESLPQSLSKVLPRVGAIVEGPAFFPRFTVRRNLQVLAKISGTGPVGIDRAIERVGLADRAESNAKDLSLGMRQRLAIACALIKDPEVLIFDEPANGLDPQGIVQVRELIRELGAEGRTVLISSHILSEIQQVADHVAIFSHGRTVASGRVTSFLTETEAPGFVVRVADAHQAMPHLVAAGLPTVAMEAPDELLVTCPANEGDRIARTLAEHGMFPREMVMRESALEAAYLRLTSESGVDPEESP